MFGQPYANSGLGRFATLGSWQPSSYTPTIYRPNLLTIPNSPTNPYGLLYVPPGPSDAGTDSPSVEGIGMATAGESAIGAAIGNAIGSAVGIPGLGDAAAAVGNSGIGASVGGGEGSNPGGVAGAEGTASGATGEGSGGGPPGDGGGGGGGGK